MADSVSRSQPALTIPGWLFIPLVFCLARLVLVMGLPLEAIQGYGDVLNYFNTAALPGWPYIQYWVEFPPLFPFLSEALYVLSSGQVHVYTYLLFFVLTAADAGCLVLFQSLTGQLNLANEERSKLSWGYALLLVVLPYAWGHIEPLAVFFVLLAIWAWEKQRPGLTGLALALGILSKLFPAAIIPGLWLRGRKNAAAIATAAALGLPLLIYLCLYTISPEYTAASFSSQGRKGSWETVWALIDGNLRTGNFGPVQGRIAPETAYQPGGRPAVLPVWLTIIPFGLIGLWITRRVPPQNLAGWTAYIGLTLCLLWLWSPGWSPQWVLYLIPLVLLALPARQNWLFVALLLMVNLAEWPVLLSRGMFWGLWLTVPLRTVLFGLLAWTFYEQLRGSSVELQPADR